MRANFHCTVLFGLFIALTSATAGAQSFVGTNAPAEEMQAPQEKLPIEIELLYAKLRGQTPDYDGMIRKAGILQGDDKAFGYAALVAQQREILRKIYAASGPGYNFLLRKPMQLIQVDETMRHVTLKGIDMDQPFLYTGSGGEKYGVFILNSREFDDIGPPYAFEDMPLAQRNFDYNERTIPTEITVSPVAADATDFTLENGEAVHVILAEMVSLELNDPHDRDKLILQKIYKKAAPAPLQPLSKLLDGTAGRVQSGGALPVSPPR